VVRDFDLTVKGARAWFKQSEVDDGRADGLTSAEREELARLRRENRRLQSDVASGRRLLCRLRFLRLCGHLTG